MKYLPTILTQITVGMAITLSISQAPAIAASLVRKNVIDLTPQEKTDFVDAIKTLKKTPGTNNNQVSIYDEFVSLHTGAMTFSTMKLGGQITLPQDTPPTGPAAGVGAAHDNGAFLPWHREYLSRFEKALQSVNANVTLPYWDWTDPQSVDVIFQPDFLGTNGSGQPVEIPGTGIILEGGPVQSGNFSNADGWDVIPELHSYIATAETLGSSVVRYLAPDSNPPGLRFPLDKAEADRILESENYHSFRAFVEGEITIDENGDEQICIDFPCTHNLVHGLVGGTILNPSDPNIPIRTLGTMSNTPGSPNDPLFFLLHSNVDRLWAEWQNDNRQGKEFYSEPGTEPYGHNINDRMWPWDGGDSIPGSVGSIDIKPYLPLIKPKDIVTPVDTLNISNYGYTYDTIANTGQVTTIPETSSTFGFLSLGILGAICLKQRKHFSRS